MTGTPEGSTESGFMEKPGIEPATPGLQGIALIHYTTEASCPFSLNVSEVFFDINKIKHNGYIYDANINFSASFLAFGFSD